MELLLFRPKEWEAMYNCNRHSQSQWNSHKVVRMEVGIVCLVIGTVYSVVYVPCLYIMTKKPFWRHSCYKLMFLLGIMDLLGLFVNAFTSGFFMIEGDIFCSRPKFIYTAGAIGFGAWGGQCLTCMILAFNRCVELWGHKQHRMKLLFENNSALFWYIPVLVYFLLFSFLAPPGLFSSKNMMWMQNPYYGIDEIRVVESKYRNTFNVINNITILSTLIVLNLFIIATLRTLGHKTSRSVTMASIQAVLLCTSLMAPAALYVYMDNFHVPDWLKLVNLFAWQFSNGCAVFVYTLLNASIRRPLLQMISPWRKHTITMVGLSKNQQKWLFRKTTVLPISTIALQDSSV